MYKRFAAFAAVLGLALSVTVVEAAGDAAAGKRKFDTCMGCHGIPGYFNVYPSYRVPKLGGQNAQYLIQALTAYQNGQRAHETMRSQAASLSDRDIADIAAYLSGLSGTAGE